MSFELLSELSEYTRSIRSADWDRLRIQDICLDNLFLSVRLNDGHCGVAMNYDLEGHHAITPEQVDQTRAQMLELVAEDPLLWNYLQRDTPSDAHNALWVAVLSALAAPVLNDPQCLEGMGLKSVSGRTPLKELSMTASPVVTILGFGGYLEEALAQDWVAKVNCIDFLVSSDDFRQRNPYPFQLQAEASQRMQVIYDDGGNAFELLEEADILCVSASTLTNRSLEQLLPRPRYGRVVVLEGPSGGVLPKPLFNRGVTHLVHNPVDLDFVNLCHRFSRQSRLGLQKITSGRFIDILLPEQRTVSRASIP